MLTELLNFLVLLAGLILAMLGGCFFCFGLLAAIEAFRDSKMFAVALSLTAACLGMAGIYAGCLLLPTEPTTACAKTCTCDCEVSDG